ncbi:MAG: hypothetical protein ACXQS3_02275 [Candidatus Methanofastidiosia archaeon]
MYGMFMKKRFVGAFSFMRNDMNKISNENEIIKPSTDEITFRAETLYSDKITFNVIF